jgi:hypothetical protein
MKTNMLMMTIAASLLGLPAAASAEMVTATYTGSVTSVFNSAGGLPSAAEGDSIVATFVFDLDQSTGSSFFTGDGGEISGPSGSFVTASLTINGVVTTALPPFNTGELIGQTNVFGVGSIIGVNLFGTGTSYETSVTGTDFAFPLNLSPVAYSYDPTDADQTSIFLSDNAGDIIEGDISNATLTVAVTPPPIAAPEPSTWAMISIGFAGFGFVSYRSRRRATLAA